MEQSGLLTRGNLFHLEYLPGPVVNLLGFLVYTSRCHLTDARFQELMLIIRCNN